MTNNSKKEKAERNVSQVKELPVAGIDRFLTAQGFSADAHKVVTNCAMMRHALVSKSDFK